MRYKQGPSFPPTAKGIGILVSIIGLGVFFMDGEFRLSIGTFIVGIPILLSGLMLLFSKTEIDFSMVHEGVILRRYGLPFFKLTGKVKLKEYDAAIIKKVSVSYAMTTGADFGFLVASGDMSQTFVGLFLKCKGNFSEELLIKGNRGQMLALINEELSETNLRFFDGSVRKDMEIKLDKHKHQ